MLTVPEPCKRWTELHRPGGNYGNDVAADFAMIEPYLPKRVEKIIDIGCGMAGIDVYLMDKYPNARLELVDSDGERVEYGYVDYCTPYNSRAATELLLRSNGLSVDLWHDIGTKEVLEADLIISLLSWGFHYPLSAYNVRGTCIADIRRGRDPVRGTVIWAASHSDRCIWKC